MIDWERVNELKAEVGPEDFAEIVTLFLDEADDAVARMLATNSAKSLESELHFLKGSALNLGFAELANACQSAERAAAQGSTSIDTQAIADLYRDSRRAFETAGSSAAA